MRLCRFEVDGQTGWGLYDESSVLAVNHLVTQALPAVAAERQRLHGWGPTLEISWEAALPLGSAAWVELMTLLTEYARVWDEMRASDVAKPGNKFDKSAGVQWLALEKVHLLPPVAAPPKLLLLAGNYADHVVEQGGVAAEKERTFPYIFTKPPTTTLVGSGTPFVIPRIAPEKLDHEVELGVIIGKRLHAVSAAQARQAIVGYTVINDISNRAFQPNKNRQARPRDAFFDWQHGKWHDGSCPCGPCITLADAIADPQRLELTLEIDGEIRQAGSTGQMIFSVAELVEFISSFMTLEPGDIISTGTPAGVGNATGRYLQAGQTLCARIASIGTLVTPITQ